MPTPKTTAETTTPTVKKPNVVVQQAPRTRQEFQFAHRLLRKLVHDSTFFPSEFGRRGHIWFPPRNYNDDQSQQQERDDDDDEDSNYNIDHADSSISMLNAVSRRDSDNDDEDEKSCVDQDQNNNDQPSSDDDDDNYYAQQQQQQQQLQQRSKRRTPLFNDYCLRSYYAAELKGSSGQKEGSSMDNNNVNSVIIPDVASRSGGGANNNNSMMSSSTYRRRPSSPSYCSSRRASTTSWCSSRRASTTSWCSSRRPSSPSFYSNASALQTTATTTAEEDSGVEDILPASVCTVETPTSGSGGDVAIHQSVIATTELPFQKSNHREQRVDVKRLPPNPIFPRPSTNAKSSTPTPKSLSAATQSSDTTTITAITNNTKLHKVYSIHEKELEFGKILGSGGFGEVRLARRRKNHDLSTTTTDNTVNNNDTALVDNTTTIMTAASNEDSSPNNNNNSYFAMKYLSPDKTSPVTNKDPEEKKYVTKFERGIADLAMEARYLSVLSHENIIKLWYVSEGTLEEVFNCSKDDRRKRKKSGKHSRRKKSSNNDDNTADGDDDDVTVNRYHHQHGYFLLLDALCETLLQRIQRTYVPQVIDTPLRIYEANKKTYVNNDNVAKRQLAGRLLSLKSIASALQYLHEDCNLIYRDLKPSNIGFYRNYHHGDNTPRCVCGHVESGGDDKQTQSTCTCNYTDIPKLFDFGLAKELKTKYQKAHPAHSHGDPPTFKLTSATGSRRYMSPEVALRQPYNEKTDVYSFGMVLYQVSALVVPFYGLAMTSHEEIVVREGLRPDVTIPSKESSVRRTRDFRRHYRKEADKGKKKLMLARRARCVWPEKLIELIRECWEEDMRKRPQMSEVVTRLDGCIEELNRTS